MSDLLESVLRAHGGLERWNTFEKVSATFETGGGLMPLKGVRGTPGPNQGTATIHYESTVVSPYVQPDWRMVFTPEQVLIETKAGKVLLKGRFREARLPVTP